MILGFSRCFLLSLALKKLKLLRKEELIKEETNVSSDSTNVNSSSDSTNTKESKEEEKQEEEPEEK